MPERRRGSPVGLALRALTDPMALLLLVAGPTYLLLGDYADAAVTLAALVPIVAVGLVLEVRAERALDRLAAAAAPTATVLRDSAAVEVPAASVVPGDVLILKEGDVVPADGCLVSSMQFLVDESALTGESLPVAKEPESAESEPGSCEVFAGTTVLSGRGIARVETTGPEARYGRIAGLVAAAKQPPTPLQRLIRRLVRRLGVVAGIFCVAVTSVELAYGHGWGEAIIAGVSLGIAAIPEEFPMVFTLYLALGAWRLAKNKALIRKLAAAETLGSTTVICTDKTGTLTLGKLEVSEVACLGPTEHEVLEAAVLASEPEPFDPLEKAILAYASEHGVAVADLHSRRMLHDYAFDPAAKYMSHVWQVPGGSCTCAKGSLEGILAVAGASEAHARAAAEANERLASKGMRVIAVGRARHDSPAGRREEDEAGLELVGLVGFSDPLRPGVGESLGECREAGVRVIMVTGDHPVTAQAVASDLGLLDEGSQIATGAELEAASDDELVSLAGSVSLFARADPEDKHRLVRALKERGEVVAMTGDGINDAPALREADIGIAMGDRGTEVAREAAAMVLLDDNFSTIVGAVRNGRRIFENLRKAFSYLIAFHTPLLLAALVVPLAGEPLLLLPIHLVLLELVLHPTVSLVFVNDPPPDDLMERAPRPPGVGLLAGGGLARPLASGVLLSGVVLFLYLRTMATGGGEHSARALALAAMLAGQLLMLLAERSPSKPVWSIPLAGNPALLPVLGGTTAVLFGMLYLAPVARILKLAPLGGGPLLLALAAGFAAVLVTEPLKSRARNRGSGGDWHRGDTALGLASSAAPAPGAPGALHMKMS